MIDLKRGTKLMTDCEVLDNVADYIRRNVGAQDWRVHIHDISGYIAAGIGWHENEVRGYLNENLKQ